MGAASNERIHCPKGQAVKVIGTDFRGYTGKTAHDARSSTAKERKATIPPPRHDEVYFEGLEWLNGIK